MYRSVAYWLLLPTYVLSLFLCLSVCLFLSVVLSGAVTWSENIGFKTSSVWYQKIGLGLAGLMLCCETQSFYVHRHNHLEGHSNFSSTICSFSILYSMLETSLLWRSTMAFTYLNVKCAKCLSLLPVVLVFLFWSWSWSWEFGLVYIAGRVSFHGSNSNVTKLRTFLSSVRL